MECEESITNRSSSERGETVAAGLPSHTSTTFVSEPGTSLLFQELNPSSGKRQRGFPLTPLYSTCRVISPRNLQSLFEKKYLVSKQALLSSDPRSHAQQKLFPSGDNLVDAANAKLDFLGSGRDTSVKSTALRNNSDMNTARKSFYAFPPPSSSEASSPSSSIAKCLSPQYRRLPKDKSTKNNNRAATKSLQLSRSSSEAARKGRPEHCKNEHLFTKTLSSEHPYTSMEKAVDLFLDHNKLLEDLRRVQPVGLRELYVEERGNALYQSTGAEGADISNLKGKGLSKTYAARPSELCKDLDRSSSPRELTNATTPKLHTHAGLMEVDAAAVGAYHSVTMTRVSGNSSGSHVVLRALEWERFKRVVTNLISANLELQSRLRSTQRHFRSLGYSGNLEQTLAKLKSEEFRIRREMAVRETQFSDSYRLSAKLQQHKTALITAEQRVRGLKNQVRKMCEVRRLLRRAKESIQRKSLQVPSTDAHVDEADVTMQAAVPTSASRSGATEPLARVYRNALDVDPETNYVEIYKEIRLAANKCFIVSFYAPSSLKLQQSCGQREGEKARCQPWKGCISDEERAISTDLEMKGSEPAAQPVTSSRSPSARDDKSDLASFHLDLKRVAQLFLRRQMDETVLSHSNEILLVVYNVETSDANIQPLRLKDPFVSTASPPSANVRAALRFICQNLRLVALPSGPNTGRTTCAEGPGSTANRYTLMYTSPTPTNKVVQKGKEKHRVVLGGEVDESGVLDAEESLLYVGCHEMGGGSRGAPRHYLIRLYRCNTRYLVARAFNPRAAVLYSCWIDVHWAMQVYQRSHDAVLTTPHGVIANNGSKTAQARPSTPRSEQNAAQSETISSQYAAADSEQASDVSDLERIVGDKGPGAAGGRRAKPAQGPEIFSKTAFTPRFIRFLVSLLEFDQGRLCITAMKTGGTNDGSHPPSARHGTAREKLLAASEWVHASRSDDNEHIEKNKILKRKDARAACEAASGEEVDTESPQEFCTLQEGHGLLECLLGRSTAASSCNDVIDITHAQIVQRSLDDRPESSKPCFMLIRSYTALTRSRVIFVVYEPISKCCTGSSFSLIEALTMLQKRTRTFLQRIGVGEALLNDLLAAAKSSSAATSHQLSTCTVQSKRTGEAEDSHWALFKNCPPTKNKSSPTFGSHQSPNIASLPNETTLLVKIEDGFDRRAEQGMALSIEMKRAEDGNATAQSVSAIDRDQKRAHFTGNSKEECANGIVKQVCDMQNDPPRNQIVIAQHTVESGVEWSRPEEILCAAGDPALLCSGDTEEHETVHAVTIQSRKRQPAGTETTSSCVMNAQEQGGSPEHQLISANSLHFKEIRNEAPNASAKACFSLPASTVAGNDEQNGACNGTIYTQNVQLVQDPDHAFTYKVHLDAADGENQSDHGLTRERLSGTQWKSIIEEMFIGLKLRGKNVVIPGLTMVPVSGLSKVVTRF